MMSDLNYKPNLKIERLDISVIQINEVDRRAVSEETVQDIVASAKTYGTILDPVKVRKARRKDGERFDLMDGAHRIEACKRLDWKTVPALLWVDIPDAAAKLIEFDANIARNEPDAFERCYTVWQRKKIYDDLYPETAQGIAGAIARWDASATNAVAPFAASTASLLGIKERQVYNLVNAVSGLSEEELRALRHAKARVNVTDLKKLSSIAEPQDRQAVIGQLVRGQSGSLREALAKLTPQQPSADPDEQAFSKLLDVWSRASKKAKRRFVSDQSAELSSLLNDPDGGL